MTSIVATGAVLCGGAAIVHNNFSPISRVERMHSDVREAEDIYREVIREAPRLQTVQGRELVAHSRFEQMHSIRIKVKVRELKQEVRKAPFYKRSFSYFFKSLGGTEIDVKKYFQDAMNTSALVSKIITDDVPKRYSDEEILQRLTDALDTLAKQNADSRSSNNSTLPRAKGTLSTIKEEQGGDFGWTY